MIKTLDRTAVNIDVLSGLVRIDGIIACKKVIRNGVVYLQFKDGDRLRSSCRKCNLVEIALDEFKIAIQEADLMI